MVSIDGVMQAPVLIGHYERDGEIEVGDAAADAPSQREIARRERMTREG